jgi:hypothetical protein
MKFMLIMQGTRKGWESMSTWKPEEIRAHIHFMTELVKELGQKGELVMAQGLDIPKNAKIVSAKEAKSATVSDGPFAESKEFLAGFWIVDVAAPERAVEIAAHASTAPGPGGKPMGIPIEIRQVMSAPNV